MISRNSFGTVVCAFLVLSTSSTAALGQNAPASDGSLPGNGDDRPASFSETMAGPSQSAGYRDVGPCPSCFCPRWTVSADFIILNRIGGASQTLVERTPFTIPPVVPGPNTPGTEALNSTDLQQGFSGGPRIDLIGHGDGDHPYDLEFSYFQTGGWNSDRAIGPDSPPDWLVMKCPGFVQTNQPPFDKEAMQWQYATQLHNAEFNVRWNPCYGVTMLTGFRWVNLNETLVGALNPPTISWEPPFWNTSTTNNLYGLQIGADGKLLDWGRFSVDGLVKAGIYDNNADQTTAVSVIHKQVRTAFDTINHAAGVGEIDLQCKYRVTKGLSLTAGYEVIWLGGVALAPGQIQETNVIISPKTVQALGVNCGSSVFFHGATVGVEYSF